MQTEARERTIGEMVAEKPALARVFQRLGLDFCCGGKRPLAEVCQESQLDYADVLAQLEAVEHNPLPWQNPDTAQMNGIELTRHIEKAHHDWLRHELPRLGQMVGKATSRHGAQLPWLYELEMDFRQLAQSMLLHMRHEEDQTFPAVRTLLAGEELSPYQRRILQDELSQLESEHAHAGQRIRRLRELCNDYVAPERACNTFRAMLQGLEVFEQEMHMHMHLENNQLFPLVAAELESWDMKVLGRP